MNVNRVFYLVMAICQVIVAKAQFSSSQDVFCYQYVKTINDGISSKRDASEIIFVNFQKDMMGLSGFTSAKNVGKKLVDDPNYYDDLAIEDLAESYRKWKNSPSNQDFSVYIYMYNGNFSTSSKYSYVQCKKEKVIKWHFFNGFPSSSYNVWSDPKWQDRVYSYSIDKSELIIWSKSDTGNRDYYKRIDPSSLKPKTDFLY